MDDDLAALGERTPGPASDWLVRLVLLVEVGLAPRGVAVAAERDANSREGEPDRQDMRLVPGRPDLGRVPEDGPESEEDGRREPDPPPDRQPAEHPPGDARRRCAPRIAKTS